MSTDVWSTLLGFAERHAWIAAFAIAFVLLVPEEAAVQLGIKAIREAHQGYLWIAFLVAALLTVAGIAKYVDRRVGGWLSRRQMEREDAARRVREEREEAAKRAKIQETLKLRLSSLNDHERGIVMLCLYRRSQSFTATVTHPGGESLCNKDLAARGSGSILNMPYHFTDDTWRYLLEHRNDFLTEEEARDPTVQRRLAQIEENLYVN